MSDYKRLTNKEYLNKPKCFNCEHNYSNCITCERYCVDGDCFELRSELRRLAELEDKIENGTLIELPCKVGDKLYSIPFDNSKIFEHKVKGFRIIAISENKQSNYIESDIGFLFGENAFLTKPEAEAKLEQIRKGEYK